jgi:hypothetical protein
MPHEYDAVVLQLGVALQDWMRITARAPLPRSLRDLLDRLEANSPAKQDAGNRPRVWSGATRAASIIASHRMKHVRYLDDGE